MKRIITQDDIIDVYAKFVQRGFSFIKSKFTLNAIERSKSAFNEASVQSANWWIIPSIQKRWNKLITGDELLGYESFVVTNFFKKKKKLKMLSLGSGGCHHELKFAAFDNFEEIICIDISDIPLKIAKEIADKKKLTNINFITQNVYEYDFPENKYDIVFFHASLHHFKDIDSFVSNELRKTLKPNGKLIINEFVGPNRLQFPKYQIKATNDALKLIPKKFRKRFKLNFYKNKVYGSGLIRMFVADPSECIESAQIIPSIHKHYKTIYEVPYGGNILALALKDIAHHFVLLNEEKEVILKKLFEYEDQYIKEHSSDFVFGVFENNKPRTQT